MPHISWVNTCKAKKHGGIGIKDFTAWNKATIAKLVWAIATKKDSLWVKWVHGRYIRNKDWWDYSPPTDCSWTWKKVCAIKEIFKAGCLNPRVWKLQGKDIFKVSYGYQWLIGGSRISWGKLIWSRASIPRHAFIAWVYMQKRLPTKVRLNRFAPRLDLQCPLCATADEDCTHLFLECSYAKEVWDTLDDWWPIYFRTTQATNEDWTTCLTRYKGPKAHKLITYAIFTAGVYFIWYARNHRLFKHQMITTS